MKKHLKRDIGDAGNLVVDMYQYNKTYIVTVNANGEQIEETKHRKLDRAVNNYEKILRSF